MTVIQPFICIAVSPVSYVRRKKKRQNICQDLFPDIFLSLNVWPGSG